MKLRIRAQRRLDGSIDCRLVITSSSGAEVTVPAVLDDTNDEAVLSMLDDGSPLTLDATAPLIEAVTVAAGRIVDVRGVEAAETSRAPGA